MQQQDGSMSSAVSFCPSFSIYSADKLADIADKLVSTQEEEEEEEEDVISNGEDDDFGFVPIASDFDSRRFFSNGEISRVFPVFNRRLLFNGDYDYSTDRGNDNEERHVAALKKIFIDDDRDGDDEGRQASSSTSSEEDEPEREPNATFFCIWSSPKRNPTESPSPPPPTSRCKKSNSTGSSSKKWFKFRNLLQRSHSDGNDLFVFFSKPKTDSKDKKVKSGRVDEAFYVRNRAIKEGDRKKSYLPYKQDLLRLSFF